MPIDVLSVSCAQLTRDLLSIAKFLSLPLMANKVVCDGPLLCSCNVAIRWLMPGISSIVYVSCGCWTFRYFASSSPGRFAATLDDSLPGLFATWTFRHLDALHLWTSRYQDVSLPSWTTTRPFVFRPARIALVADQAEDRVQAVTARPQVTHWSFTSIHK